jgi:hypothetical protein
MGSPDVFFIGADIAADPVKALRKLTANIS